MNMCFYERSKEITVLTVVHVHRPMFLLRGHVIGRPAGSFEKPRTVDSTQRLKCSSFWL